MIPSHMAHVKLHIPGPVEVSEKTFRAFCSPMIGHRGQGFKDLYASIQPQLQSLFQTRQLVFISTSSAWGIMEGALRNLVAKKVLCCMNGAFSDKWLDVANAAPSPPRRSRSPGDLPFAPNRLIANSAPEKFDALTLIHNETSTGTMSPLAEIASPKAQIPGRDVHRGLGQFVLRNRD
jgi:aspartate aminotransferase-like enzyme